MNRLRRLFRRDPEGLSDLLAGTGLGLIALAAYLAWPPAGVAALGIELTLIGLGASALEGVRRR